MSNELTVFEEINIEFLTKEDVNFEFEGDILYSGAQSMELLGYGNTSDALIRHVDEKNKFVIQKPMLTNKKKIKLKQRGDIYISLNGLKQAIASSKLPKAHEIAKQMGILIHKPRMETELHEILRSLFSGLCDFIPQYRCCNGKYKVDFYDPGHRIAVEYDENHHRYSKKYDIQRQEEIELDLGCIFVRIEEGKEFEGLNKLIKNIGLFTYSNKIFIENLNTVSA